MSSWVLVPSLVALRREFDALSPGRDRGADGSIGDSAHTSSSDHTPDEDSDVLRDHDADSKNEVHALDIDSTGPWPEPFAALVQRVIARDKARWLDPNDVCRLEYVIFNRKIYSRSRDFAPRAYNGSDPHTNHAHFSGRYLTASESDTSPWGVLEDDVTKDEFKAWMSEWAGSASGRAALGSALLEALLPAPAGVEDADGKWYLKSYVSNTYPAAVAARDAATAAGSKANQALVALGDVTGRLDLVLSRLPETPPALGGSEATGR